ncbi:MAG: glycosyltransferase family 2 protein [Patescibacteria group bacterium]
MALVSETVFYLFVFLSIYVQVFFFVTFLENRKKIVIRDKAIKLDNYPGVTLIVPSLNEETTVFKTIQSLLSLNYPKDKLKIFLIDDGSTDGTWSVFKKFENYPYIKIFKREKNAGKHMALNLGLENTETEFVGCLDADSLVDSEALVRIMSYFERDSTVMAVAPAVVVNNPRGFIQNAQKIEYHTGIYFKKMLGFLGAINVTPGPFTIFKKKVFDDLGPYRYAHNTEDMEIAYRMQKNHYKIDHCNDAYVYTNTPYTVRKLFTQRLRWIYGFINNTIDYRGVLFNKKYGNFSTFTLPMGVVTILSVGYVFMKFFYGIGQFIFNKIVEVQAVGLPAWSNSLDPFFINTRLSVFITVIIYSLLLFSIIIGSVMTRGTKERRGFPYEIAFYLVIFGFLAPFWIMKAVYNTIISKAPAWR